MSETTLDSTANAIAEKPVSPATKEKAAKNSIFRSGFVISTITLATLIALWALITHLGFVDPLYLPSPLDVVRKFFDLIVNGYADATLWQHFTASISRIFIAVIVAAIIAIPVGLAIGINPVARAIFDPLIEFYRPVPPLAYLPLIVIWFGIGEFSKILLIYLAVFAPIVVATAAGARHVDPIRIRVAQSLGATRWQIIRHIVLPSALPDMLIGIRIGLGAGWSTLVAAELVAATEGIGFMIQSASQFLVTDIVIAGILVIALVAYIIEIGLRILQQKLAPWRGKVN
ncbi:MAG: taurine ABC transporter permease TauC [Cellvibrio sp.]|uniref:taurine ABC transporter permease TauC n=1 Tax=Cellvibrio sp. TaxID=1965322 RepID=UPI0031B48EEE